MPITTTVTRPASPVSRPASPVSTSNSNQHVIRIGAAVAQGEACGCCCPAMFAAFLLCGEGGGSGSNFGAGSLSGGTANPTNNPCLEYQDPKNHPCTSIAAAANGCVGGIGFIAVVKPIGALITPALSAYAGTCALLSGIAVYTACCSDRSDQDQTDSAQAENSGTAAPKTTPSPSDSRTNQKPTPLTMEREPIEIHITPSDSSPQDQTDSAQAENSGTAAPKTTPSPSDSRTDQKPTPNNLTMERENRLVSNYI